MQLPARFDIPIVLLAAGASRRMKGRDKLLEIVDEKPLIVRQVDLSCRVSTQVIVALPDAPHPRRDALKGKEVRRVTVPDAHLGMSASIKAGMQAVPEDAFAVMILLADLVELTAEDLCKVMRAAKTENHALIWRGATRDGKAGHPVVFHRSLFSELAQVTGDTGGASVIRAHASETMLVPLPGNHARCDLDTPEDWAEWRARCT